MTINNDEKPMGAKIGDFVVDSESRIGTITEFYHPEWSPDRWHCKYRLLRTGTLFVGPVDGLRLVQSISDFEIAWTQRKDTSYWQQ